jgi:hypothetical protein
MDELLRKALKGVDPDAPDAAWRIFENLMRLVPWWLLIWFTLFCVVIGAAAGWWRGRVWLGMGLALVLGPVGWFVLWAFPPGARVERRAAAVTTQERRGGR